MRLNRRTKARLVAYASPRRLLMATLAVGAVALAWQVLSFIFFALDVPFPSWSSGTFFLPLIGIHFLRWGALMRGWAPVRKSDISMLAEVFPDSKNPSQGDPKMPSTMEAALSEAIHRKGWLAWSEVMELAKTHGAENHVRHWSFMLGGTDAPVALRKDWKEHLCDRAWVGGRMARKFSRHDAPARVERARL